MDVRSSSFDFQPAVGAPQSATEVVTFPRDVRDVVVGITGYAATFVGDDHHLGRLQVEVGAAIDATDPTRVSVTGGFQLRDFSGTLDDSFTGVIQWALLADLAPALPPAPGDARPDLIVVGAESTQVIQHFRSATHLAPPNVFPDNSIRLVSNKPTALRLYVDYDAGSGLPVITRLAGLLTVTAGGSATVISALETIQPRRDSAILRGERGHTLNFVIPENLCRGTIDIRADVRDPADPTVFAAPFERSLSFDDLPTVDIQAIGINYIGPDVRAGATAADLAAPTQADFVTTMALTENLYPTPGVRITSYQIVNYDKEITSDISQGCDKFGDVLDKVQELSGDDGTIAYALYNVGVDNGSVGGCGGGGAGVGKIYAAGTTAHEIGHAFGRQHAPCDNAVRCASPRNQDDDYPTYSGFDSDSIGEYGFDVTAGLGLVKPPSTAHDMMGYSPGRWISPYTYKALFSAIPARLAASSAGRAAGKRDGDHGEWEPARVPHLFLRIDRNWDGDLVLDDCFSYPTLPRPRGRRGTSLTAELRGKDDKVLTCERLSAVDTCSSCSGSCGDACGGACVGCACTRGPLRIRQSIYLHRDAAELVLRDGRRIVHRQALGAAPVVKLEVELADDRDKDQLRLRWDIDGEEAQRSLWALVQWQDRSGVWRGVAPRTTARELAVAKALVTVGGAARLRVLVTTGLATGSAAWHGQVPWQSPPPAPIEIADGGDHVGPRLLRASTAVDARELRWYADGVQLGSGRLLDAGHIPAGTRYLSARSSYRGEVAAGVWELSWLDEDLAGLTPVDIPPPSGSPAHQDRDHQHANPDDPKES